MRRVLALSAAYICAGLAFAGAAKGPPPQLPPCMAIDEMRLVHVIRVPEYPNIFAARKNFDMKRQAKTIIAKVDRDAAAMAQPVEKPVAKTAEANAVKKKALRKKTARIKGCKPGRTKNSKGQCGRWT